MYLYYMVCVHVCMCVSTHVFAWSALAAAMTRNSLGEEGFILAHNFMDGESQWLGLWLCWYNL